MVVQWHLRYKKYGEEGLRGTRSYHYSSAEKLYITNYNNIVFFVMADEDWATATYNTFKKYAGNDIGKELEKTGDENIELPAERPVQ